MNALEKLYIVNHPLRISRYGAHTSLSISERMDIIDALSDIFSTALAILAQLKQAKQKLHNVSYLPLQKLFYHLVRANADYVDFLARCITDLGGHAEMATLYGLNEVGDVEYFSDCIQRILQGARRLCAAEALLDDYRECAVDQKDNASKRLFEACSRQNTHFISVIHDGLLSDRPL